MVLQRVKLSTLFLLVLVILGEDEVSNFTIRKRRRRWRPPRPKKCIVRGRDNIFFIDLREGFEIGIITLSGYTVHLKSTSTNIV